MKALDWLYELILNAYAPEKHVSDYYDPDFVIASEYCVLRDNSLPEASILCLKKALSLSKNAPIVWGSTNYLGPGYQYINILKMDLVPQPAAMVVSNNTIEESAQLCETVLNRGGRKILVICDQAHRPRLEEIYLHFLNGTDAAVEFHSVPAQWNKPHYSWIQSNRWTWLAGNFVHHLLLRLRGVEAMRKVRQ